VSERKPVTDWATDFDIFDPDYNAEPGEVWAELHAKCPVAHTERYGGMYMATRYADARELAVMTSALSNRQVSLSPMPQETDLLADYHSAQLPPISNDPPTHAPLRRLILPFFSPKAVERHRVFTEELCNELIDSFISKGSCDAAVDYAQALTPRVIGHMLGIDTARSDEFVEWVRGFIELGVDDIELRRRSRSKMLEFFAQRVEQRRVHPTDDYISVLLASEVDGKPLSDDAVVKFCLLLLIAGIDTTWTSLGTSLLHFATHRDDRRRMASEPELFPTAVEELLRFYAPVSVGRIAMQDVQFNGTDIKRGERMMINYPAANRDPQAFERADEFVLDREKNRHFAFGVGVHRCAGSNLARMEMDVALRTWFKRIPEFELSDPDQVSFASGQVRGARNVPVCF
jgi:cytochrome P450